MNATDLEARLPALTDLQHRTVLHFLIGWYRGLASGPVLEEFETALTTALDMLTPPPAASEDKQCLSCGVSDRPMLRIKHPVTNLLEWHCTDVRSCYDRRHAADRPLARLAEDQPAVAR